MKKDELRKRLEIEGIPQRLYDLDGGLPNDRIVLEETYQGWSVYYSERGNKFDEKEFSSENEACDYLYRQIIDLSKWVK